MTLSSRGSEEPATDDSFAAYVKQLAERQYFIYRHVPLCEKCRSEQVQIIKIDPPAVWRCRMCKHRFQYEPPAP